MTAPLGGSPHPGRVGSSGLSISQTDVLRALLLAESGEQVHKLALCAGAFVVRSPGDTTGLGRAMAALDMYGARQTIEEIDAALARIEVGEYGTCLVCDRPIPFDYLEAIPRRGSAPRAPPQRPPPLIAAQGRAWAQVAVSTPAPRPRCARRGLVIGALVYRLRRGPTVDVRTPAPTTRPASERQPVSSGAPR